MTMERNLSRRWFLFGAAAAASILTADEAVANRLRARGNAIAEAPPSSLYLAPGPGWNGTAGSGWGVAGGVARPVDTGRTKARPWARLLVPNFEAISGLYKLPVRANTTPIAGGVAYVELLADGGVQTIMSASLLQRTASNGMNDDCLGHIGTFDCPSAIARFPTGSVELFIRTVPNNPLLEPQIEGPFILHPRLPVVSQTDFGPGKVVEKILRCKPSAGADEVNVRYTSVKKCLDWATANYNAGAQVKLVKVLWEDSNTDYRIEKVAVETATPGANARTHWLEMQVLDGATNAVAGDGINLVDPTFGAGLQFDLLRWGKGIKWDWGKIAPSGSGLTLRTNSTRSMGWRECEIYCGGFPAAFGGAGTGVNSTVKGLTVPGYFVSAQSLFDLNTYFENVNLHDTPDYGFLGAKLVRGCVGDMIGGSCFENVWGAIHNTTVTRIGGGHTTLGTPAPAMSFSQSGSDTVEFAVDEQPGRIRTFTVWINNVPSTLALVKGTSPTKISELVAWLNGLGHGITATTTNERLAAIFLSDTAPVNEDPIFRQPLTSANKVLTTWVAIHSNAVVWHSAPRYNVSVFGLRCYNILGANLISFNSSTNRYTGNPLTLAEPGMNDVGIENCVMVDPGATHSGGYFGPTCRHVGFLNNTLIGGLTNWTDNFLPDAMTQWHGNYAKSLSFSNRVLKAATSLAPAVVAAPTDMLITSLAVLASAQTALPANSDAKCTRISGTEDSLFQDLSNVMSPNCSPTSALRLNDNSIPGALMPDGSWKLAA